MDMTDLILQALLFKGQRMIRTVGRISGNVVGVKSIFRLYTTTGQL